MRKTIARLEAELAAARQEAAQWKEAYRVLAEVATKQYATYPIYPYWYSSAQTLTVPQTVNLPYITCDTAPAGATWTTLTVDGKSVIS